MNYEPRITFLLSQSISLFRMKLNARLAETGINLTSEMCGVLQVLWREDGKRQQDIADFLSKDKGGIAKIINGLEQRQLVRRITDRNDARNKLITLTEEGREIRKKVSPLINALHDEMLAGSGEKDIDTTKKILQKIINHLKE